MILTAKNFLIFFSIFLGFILFSEIFLRIVYKERLKTRVYPLIYEPDTDLGFKYIPNVNAEISIPGIHKKFTINSNGFYGSNFNREKSNGRYRIAVIGASEATGIWMNGTDNFCIKLQRIFDSLHINAEVINFSIDGRGRDLYNINLIQIMARQYTPDLFLLNTNIPFIHYVYTRSIYKNYAITYNPEDESTKKWCLAKIDSIESNKMFINMYYLSYILRFFCRYYIHHQNDNNSFNLSIFIEKKVASKIYYIPLSVEETLGILKSTQIDLQHINSNLVLFSYDKFDSILNKYAGKIGVTNTFLNIAYDNNMTDGDDSHPNDKGQYIIAQHLFNKFIILNNKIIGIKN